MMKKTDRQSGIRVMSFLLRQELFTCKTMIVLVVMAVYIYSNIEPIKMFSKAVQVKATPMSSVFLFSDFTCQTTILLGLLFLISNVPFQGKVYRYAVSRSGYSNWAVGTILYILLLTFFYTCYVVIVSNLSMINVLELQMEWGKIWGTLARTNAGVNYGLTYEINDYIIGKYDADKAFVISFILEWVCMFWLTLCTYTFNILWKKGSGIAVSAIFIFLDTMIYNSWTPWAYLISPITLANIASYKKSNLSYGITVEYTEIFFAITIMLFIILIIFGVSRKKDTMDFE